MEIKELSNAELAIAVVKCLDAYGTTDGCHGCPLEDEMSCAYHLKIEVVKRLTRCDEMEIPR